MLRMFGADSSMALSIPRTKKICGYEIKKMPLGAYIRALDQLDGLPESFIHAVFPDMDSAQVIAKVKDLDMETIEAFIQGVFLVFPRYFVGFTAEIAGIPKERLLNDENIGLEGFMAIWLAIAEVNRLGKLPGSLAALKRIMAPGTN